MGIYATNTAEVCNYIINDCKAKVLVVENKQQIEKLLFGRDKSYFKKIIQFNNTEPIDDDYNGLVCSVKYINFNLDAD
jgi:long-subunit acyl-CoA synthetase (AMP-forming)